MTHTGRIIKDTPEWMQEDESPYLRNGALIKKLLFEQRQSNEKTRILESERQVLSTKIHELELQNRELTIYNRELQKKLSEMQSSSLLIVGLSVLSSILSGIGINWITGDASELIVTGWILVGVAVIFQVGIILLSRRG